jgi:hypothetical protein
MNTAGFAEKSHLEDDPSSQRVVVSRDGLRDVQVPGGALVAYAFDHLSPVGIRVECVLAGNIALIAHLFSSILLTYPSLNGDM